MGNKNIKTIEIHILRNLPPHCANRDESGTPKTCTINNGLRSRLSSQYLKHGYRIDPAFREALGEEQFGFRSKLFPREACNELAKRGVSKEVCDILMPLLSGLGTASMSENKIPDETALAIFYDAHDMNAIVSAIEDFIKDMSIADLKKVKGNDLQNALIKAHVNQHIKTFDVALFGRMVTSPLFDNVESALSVSHAVSTHNVALDTDFWTQVDDVEDQKGGAANMGDTSFVSACYYYSAIINLDILRNNLNGVENQDEIIRNGISAFIRTMIYAPVRGNQTAFSSNTFPAAVLVNLKDNCNNYQLSNAFENPVSRYDGYTITENSIKRLVEENDILRTRAEIPVEKCFFFTAKPSEFKPKTDFVDCNSLTQLLDGLKDSL